MSSFEKILDRSGQSRFCSTLTERLQKFSFNARELMTQTFCPNTALNENIILDEKRRPRHGEAGFYAFHKPIACDKKYPLASGTLLTPTHPNFSAAGGRSHVLNECDVLKIRMGKHALKYTSARMSGFARFDQSPTHYPF